MIKEVWSFDQTAGAMYVNPLSESMVAVACPVNGCLNIQFKLYPTWFINK